MLFSYVINMLYQLQRLFIVGREEKIMVYSKIESVVNISGLFQDINCPGIHWCDQAG
jgi:hypothetical protein